MKPFRFHRDELFLVGCAAYLLNRLVFQEALHSTFLHDYFDDLWLIPCALPLLLWLHRLLGWRGDEPPTLLEVGSHLVVWSIFFEWWGPQIVRHVTRDPVDVACYWIGGLLAWLWWNRSTLRHRLVAA